MHYCLVICRVSSTGHIYHRAAKLMIAFHFYFYPNNDPISPKGPRNRFSERRFSKKKPSYNRLNGKAWLGLLPVRIYWEIMPSTLYVSVNLIGEKNQVILKLLVRTCDIYMYVSSGLLHRRIFGYIFKCVLGALFFSLSKFSRPQYTFNFNIH